MSALRMNLCESWILHHRLASSGNQVERSLDLVQVIHERCFSYSLGIQDEASHGMLESEY